MRYSSESTNGSHSSSQKMFTTAPLLSTEDAWMEIKVNMNFMFFTLHQIVFICSSSFVCHFLFASGLELKWFLHRVLIFTGFIHTQKRMYCDSQLSSLLPWYQRALLLFILCKQVGFCDQQNSHLSFSAAACKWTDSKKHYGDCVHVLCESTWKRWSQAVFASSIPLDWPRHAGWSLPQRTLWDPKSRVT